MGCFNCVVLPPEVKNELKDVAPKLAEISNTFLIKAKTIEKEQKEIIEERHKKVSEADKSDDNSLKKLLLEYNKKEIENEKEIIGNQVDKLHTIYETSLEIADKLKKKLLDEFKKQAEKANEIAKVGLNASIKELEKQTPKDFLDSKFGKPLKKAIEKEGLKEEYLQEFIENLKNERKKRREDERKEFGISQNEFPPEDELHFTTKELYEAIFEEYKDEFKSQIMEKILGKIK